MYLFSSHFSLFNSKIRMPSRLLKVATTIMMNTTILLESCSFTSSFICLGFMVKKVIALITISERLNMSQPIMILVSPSIARPDIHKNIDGIRQSKKAISNLLPAGILLNLLIWELCFNI